MSLAALISARRSIDAATPAAGGGGGGTVPTVDPVAAGDQDIVLLPSQPTADRHFGQFQGDGNTWNQNPGSDNWTYPTADLLLDTTRDSEDVYRMVTLGSHAPVSGSERRTEYSFRGSGGTYNYWVDNGSTFWLWVRYWMPSRALLTGEHIAPWQLHNTGGGNPVLACYCSENDVRVTGSAAGNGVSAVTIPALYDQWVTEILKVRQEPSGSGGIFQLWRNGSLDIDRPTLTNFGDGTGNGYWKHGTYSFPGGTGAATYNDITGGSPSYPGGLIMDCMGSGKVADDGYSHDDIANHAGFQAGFAPALAA